MQKDFDNWNNEKKKLNRLTLGPRFHEREVWFAKLGVNVKYEQDGGKEFLRPVLIVKKFSKELAWAVSLSRTKKRGKFYHVFKFQGDDSVAVLSQLRVVDARRLFYYKGRISHKEFEKIKESLRKFLK